MFIVEGEVTHIRPSALDSLVLRVRPEEALSKLMLLDPDNDLKEQMGPRGTERSRDFWAEEWVLTF